MVAGASRPDVRRIEDVVCDRKVLPFAVDALGTRGVREGEAVDDDVVGCDGDSLLTGVFEDGLTGAPGADDLAGGADRRVDASLGAQERDRLVDVDKGVGVRAGSNVDRVTGGRQVNGRIDDIGRYVGHDIYGRCSA